MKEFESEPELSRRSLVKSAGLAGFGLIGAGLLAGCGGSSASLSTGGSSSGDLAIIGAAKIAEALAVTMYSSIITDAPFFTTLPADDQQYMRAARDEEMYHYILLRANSGNTDAQTTYYFPTGMFTDPQTTINTLVTLEDAFIAAYLVGVANFSSQGLRVLAAQIMGIESDHRTLARVIANDLGLASTTGLSGAPESVSPPNDNVYERRYGLNSIGQVVDALGPFLSASATNTVVKTFIPSYTPSNSNLFPNPANG